jgi:hypothetical protein
VVSPECARPATDRVSPRLPRRPVLFGLAAVATVPSAGLVAGCGGEPDPLEALAARARSDAALIDSILALPPLSAALSSRLGPVADARRQHAVALGVELGESTASTSTPESSSAGDRLGPTHADPDDALAQVRGALDDAARQAGLLVLTLPRRRAALVGSIAACCSAYRAVLQ